MAPGPSLAGPVWGPEPSFVSLHLSWPSHHCSTGPHLLPNVTPRRLLSPSIAPQSIHNAFLLFSKSSFQFRLFFYTLHFYSLNSFLSTPAFFSNWVLFILSIRKWIRVYAPLQEHREFCYHSPVIHQCLQGTCQGTSYYCCCTYN